MKSEFTIALLGQPNSGKSTLYNGLTGARQHVGNWPGKTVEKKEGFFKYKNKEYKVVDLPGSYSLFANSEEEVITRDYIANGNADLVVILADASQLERSLFMLADYTGINAPAILLLNLIDVATDQGKVVDCKKLSDRLNIPVIPFNATDKKEYNDFYQVLENSELHNKIVDETELYSFYQEKFPEILRETKELLPEKGIGGFSNNWLISKLFEKDKTAFELVENNISKENFTALTTITDKVVDGSLHTGSCKFSWIDSLLKESMVSQSNERKISRFDKLAISRIWGKPIAVLSIFLGLFASMTIGMPLMALGGVGMPALSNIVTGVLSGIGVSNFFLGLIQDGIFTAIAVSVMMSGFVLGTLLVFGFLEQSGYMARISFVFDNTMQKLGLHGKAIMPFLVSFGCNIGGTTGTRVLDTWGQRVTVIALSWVVPCGSTWGVVALVSSLFFGVNAIWVVVSLFVVSILHIIVTAKIFGKSLLSEQDKKGIIMELPPYHKPKWGQLFKYAFARTMETLIKALKLIIPVSIIFWFLAYTPNNNIESSIIYKIGIVIEPVTMWFGLRWELFMAWVVAGVGKEAALGALTSLFNSEGIWSSDIILRSAFVDTTFISNNLLNSITKSEALAFLYAFFFHMPCLMTVGAVIQETHSWKWTLRITGYYIAVSLFLAMIAYHIGNFIF